MTEETMSPETPLTEETSVEETPTEETTVEETTVEETPAEETPAAETPAAEANAEPEAPAETMADHDAEVTDSFTTFKDDDAPNWEKLEEYRKEKTVITVTVDGVVNKGVVAHLENVRGFIPASHLDVSRVDDLNEYLGKEIEVQVLETDEAKGRLLLSRRAILRKAADEEKKARIASIEVGSTMEGTVDSLQAYGAFIKLDDDLSGLVHVSQISRNRVKLPADVLKAGQKVKVKVIAVKDGKLSLSMKALEPGGEDRGDRGFDRDDREPREKIDLPTSDALSTNLGDLLKGFNLGS